ncbi:MAG: hypothetical protein AB1696_16250 [Planctomycetota bacterium]
MVAVQSNIRVEHRGASGLEVHVPPEVTRAPRFALVTCIYLIGFLAFTASLAWIAWAIKAWIVVRILIYAALVPLAPVDFVLLVAALNAFLRRFCIEINGDALTINDYWFSLQWQKKVIPVGDITRIDYAAAGSAGKKTYHTVVVHFRRGDAPAWATLASAIADEGEARRLVSDIRAAIPHP